MDVEHTPNAQHGNFWALLQFRVSAEDTVLRDHLAQSSRNATYISSCIQNQIVDILGRTVVGKIVQRVKDAWAAWLEAPGRLMAHRGMREIWERLENPDWRLEIPEIPG